MVKTLFAQHGKKRCGFKRRDQQKFFIRMQLRDGIHDFRERLAPLAQVFPDIQRDNVFTHGLAEKVSGLESVSSMENCFVALTACGRFGGM